jgi:hypothetical protein
MKKFKRYQRTGYAEARPYEPGEDLSNVSVSDVDNPKTDTGGMVARNPENHNDQWYIAGDYFEQNFSEPVKDFGWAIQQLKLGKKVSRKGWSGKGMWLVLQTTTENIKPYHGSLYAVALKDSHFADTVTIDAHIDMYTANKTMQPGWLASQADMLGNDYYTVDGEPEALRTGDY